jgi:rhamnulokinase
MNYYLAADLGAESGRVMLGVLTEGKIALEELHRFPNTPVRLPNGLYWDSLRLFHEIVHGFTIAGRERGLSVSGIGVDTWGVDFGLLSSDGSLIDCPRHYRDDRTDGVMDKLFEIVPRSQVFDSTGTQFMPINSLYQLYSMRLANSPGLFAAHRLLFMPDLLNFWLTGIQRAEVTIASTSQFYNPRSQKFAVELLQCLGISPDILPEIVPPGTLLGPLLPALAEATKLGPANVYATAGHDTASAVAAVPAQGDNWCYISSGTWSLMGAEIDHPIINPRSLELNFTNEIGVAGKVRLLKNIAGLWLLQECRRSWAAEGLEYTYEELTRLAAEAQPAKSIIDVDAFLHPGQMPRKIAEWCRAHEQAVPAGVGDFCRTILESLAHRYREVLKSLEELTGQRYDVIHVVGGGSRNRLLNQLLADATDRVVIAGPAEATALGNILVQAIGSGTVKDLAEARAIVAHSFEPEKFLPSKTKN